MKYTGHIVDVVRREVFDGEVEVNNGVITGITPRHDIPGNAPYWMPGFIDSHVHIESSMMVPAEFARVAVEQGTIGVVADPHEIGNVLGKEGIDFMIANGRHIRFNFCFGAPSCVPSCGTDIETSGARLDSGDISELMHRDDIGFLGEMMNYPGVLADDAETLAKIEAALTCGKPVDGPRGFMDSSGRSMRRRASAPTTSAPRWKRRGLASRQA